MSDNVVLAIITFCFWGWIPILAIGKSARWIICAVRSTNKEIVEYKDVCECCESSSCNGCKY